MENKENREINDILEKLNNVHYRPGPVHQRVERFKALKCMATNELEAIHHLVESHVPGLRAKTVLRFEKILTLYPDNVQLSLSKNHVAPLCTNTAMKENVSAMLQKVREMPSEWTIVQLTPRFNAKEYVEVDSEKHYTNSLHISVFSCGLKQPKPFCVNIEAPKDSVNGSRVELLQEMYSIIRDNKEILMVSRGQRAFKNIPEKQNYLTKRQSVDNRLKLLVRDLQNLYLQEWRCLLVGKYVDATVDITIQKRIKDFFKYEVPSFILDEKTLSIIHYLVKGAAYLKSTEVRRAAQNISSNLDKKVQKNLAYFIRNLSEELPLNKQKRHPLILIVDDSLDCLPWEMMDVLQDAPVSRIPCLHLVYGLFKEHEQTIKNGFKIIEKPENGQFIVNPDLDLKNMQNRIMSFFDYWTPSWKGLAGSKPTEEQFEEMLVTSDIFSYNGHGNGQHYFSMQKIEKLRINAVVLLFGCGSTKLTNLGPQAEMTGAYQTYLIACSPCIVGMLWEVTDLDTDVLTTTMLSHWIPNTKTTHWKFVDKSEWKRGEKKADFVKDRIEVNNDKSHPHEPELLRALSHVKKSTLLNFYTTKAACVARGIPVKIVQ